MQNLFLFSWELVNCFLKGFEGNPVFWQLKGILHVKSYTKSDKMPKLECATTADYVWVHVGTLE